jgi:hypothetical protein
MPRNVTAAVALLSVHEVFVDGEVTAVGQVIFNVEVYEPTSCCLYLN